MADRPNPTETHLLIALRGGPSYGYALLQELERRSRGEISPDIGSLYRTLGRLMDRGWVEEVAAPADAEASPGRPRRYYGVTSEGLEALAREVERLEDLVRLARGAGGSLGAEGAGA